MYNLHPATMATLFMSPLNNDRGSLLGKRLAVMYRMDYSIHVVIKILLCGGYPLVSILMEHKYLHFFFTIQRSLSTYTFTNFLCYPFSNHVLSKY